MFILYTANDFAYVFLNLFITTHEALSCNKDMEIYAFQ